MASKVSVTCRVVIINEYVMLYTCDVEVCVEEVHLVRQLWLER